ncbi:MAG: BMP family ABC transporter substrate-binding protein, partial [Spirochaetales bacterium]|nr:BMP family ABC transporter substrate-binding protein [Spirochaetales bacterium]
SAHRGMERAIEEFGIVGRTVEGGWDPANWQPDIAQLAEGDWDIVIAGTWQLAQYVGDIAPDHPDKMFITYDTAVDFSGGGLDNVYSILYSQNEGSFLAGALAALLTQETSLEGVNEERVVGFIGGQDIPVINDFRVGFEQGARAIDPEVRVLATYVGSFNDPARGKELALAQIEQGADFVFGVASESSLGVIEAAQERGRYAIGVDSDQYELLRETDDAQARAIVTSMMKNVDNSIHRAIRLHLAGELPYGEAEVLGLSEGGVGLARNDNFARLVPSEIAARVEELAGRIESGEIRVESALGN